MQYETTDIRVMQKMEEWAERISSKIIIHQTVDASVPDSVAVIACMKAISKISKSNRRLLPKNICLKLLEKEFENIPDTTIKA